MAELDGDWDNLDALEAERFIAETRGKMESAVLSALILFSNELKITLSIPPARTGRVYRLSRGVTYQASAPGEPPAVQYGALRSSVNFSLPVWEGLTVSGSVGVNAVYARVLEWGGFTGRARIAARPYMEPTRLRTAERINRIFEEAFR